MQFTPVLALYDPFVVDVPLNFDITHSLTHSMSEIKTFPDINPCVLKQGGHGSFRLSSDMFPVILLRQSQFA